MARQGHCNELVFTTLVTGWSELQQQIADARLQQLPGILWQYFLNTEDPLLASCGLMLAVALFTWVWSIIFRTAAAVDRLWSIVPGVYTLVMVRDAVTRFASGQATPSDERQLLMLALCTAWCCRLTFNFVRKGGYKPGSEDYRWPIVRKNIHPLLYQIFNFVFIAIIQNILLLAIAMPAYVAALAPPSHGLTPLDLVAATLFSILLAGETIADQQQWKFQQRKHALLAARQQLTGEYADGFLQSGLFRYSRHPNFFCEVCMWWAFYLFAVAASGCWLSPAGAGAALLALLFDRSTWLTELVSAGKYSKYGVYQRRTSRLVPMWPGKVAAKLQ